MVAPDSGPFPAIHPIEALAMPMAERRTGILTMRNGPRWHDISFVDGRANRVESSVAEESLPMLLAERGKLPDKVAQEVISRVREGRGNPVEALLERGVISNDKMEELLRWRAFELIKRECTWEEGSYTFRQLLNPSLPGPPLQLALPQLLVQSLLKTADPADIRRRLMPWMTSKPRLGAKPTQVMREFGLKHADATLLDAFNGTRTLRTILTRPPVAVNRAVKLSWLLLMAGQLQAEGWKIEDAPAGQATPPEEKTTTTVDPEGVEQQPTITVDPDGVAQRATPSRADPGDVDATTSMDTEDATDTGSAEKAENRVTALGRSLFGTGFDLDVSALDTLTEETAAAAPPPSPPSVVDTLTTHEELVFDDAHEADLDAQQTDLLSELESYLAKIEATNYLGVLGLGPECSSSDVRQAFFALAKQYHPDHFAGEPGAIRKAVQEVFARLTEAHEALASEGPRTAYIDRVIHGKKNPQEVAMEQARRLMDAEQAYKIGIRLLHAGQLTDAHKKFEAAYKGDPEENEYYCYRGYTTFLLAHGHDPERSQHGVDQMTEAANTSKNPSHYHLLAKAAIKQGNDEFALELLKRVLRRQRSNEEALNEYRACEQRVAKAQRKQTGRLSGLFARFKKQ